MTIKAARLEQLLEQINSGQSKKALASIESWLEKQPEHPALLQLKAEALRITGQAELAVDAFRAAGRAGAGARNWMVAGMLLAEERRTDEALECLRYAIAEDPDHEEVLNTLVTTLFNAHRHNEGIEFARRQLAVSSNARFLSNAALLLQCSDLNEESSSAFKKIMQLQADDPSFIGSALVPARFTCDWEWIEELEQKISSWYAKGQFGAPQEYPLTHITWCNDEAYNLGVTRAYAERTVGRGQALGVKFTRAPS